MSANGGNGHSNGNGAGGAPGGNGHSNGDGNGKHADGAAMPTLGEGGVKAAPLQYPLLYMFKAMGLAAPGFKERVVELVRNVVGSVDPALVSVRPSSAGKYESISVSVYLQSEEQRRAVYEAFHAEKAIVWYV